MQTRPAAASDAEVLAALEAACFAEPWSLRTWHDVLCDAKYCILLAQDAERVFAYAAGWQVGDEAELARVGVAPEMRGAGRGEQLTRALMEEFAARGVKTVFLEVRVSNEIAQRLYERCGFEVAGRRRQYYADGEDAMVMRWDKTPE